MDNLERKNISSDKAEAVLRHIEDLAQRQFLPIVGPEKGKILADTVRRSAPKRILEVGTLIGYSAIVMAHELGSDAEIITIEIDSDEAKMAEENITKAEVRPRVRVIAGDATKVMPKLEGVFDMIFLDAAKSEYLDYLKLAEDRLKKGGVVVADNAGIFAHSMRGYLDYVRNSGRYKSRFVPVRGDGVEISTKL